LPAIATLAHFFWIKAKAFMSVVIVGSYVQDYVWQVASLPKMGESRIGQFFSGPGGKGSNQAICCHRQGVATLFIAALGADGAATAAKAYAAEIGLACHWFASTLPTAAASVVVDAQGSNLICVALGANLALDAQAVSAQAEAIRHAKVLLTQLETNLDASRTALQLAKAASVLSLLNPAPINPDVDLELIALADVLTPNETEFAFLLKHLHQIDLAPNWWRASDAQLHALCRKLSSNSVVITLGDEGAFVSHAPYRTRGDAQFCYRTPALPASAVDTTGAGDAFNAGLAAGLVKFAGAPFVKAVGYATQVAALSVERAGAALSMPTAEEVAVRWATQS
jgi:ribokinase